MTLATHEVQTTEPGDSSSDARGPHRRFRSSPVASARSRAVRSANSDGAWEQQLSDLVRERVPRRFETECLKRHASAWQQALESAIHEVLRRRLADDIRAALIEGQGGPEGSIWTVLKPS